MKTYRIWQGATGAVVWTGAARDEIGALDAMAHAAGYYDHSDIPEDLRAGGLRVEIVPV